jgi:amylosucrase
MYEQVVYALPNFILDELKQEIRLHDLQHFDTRPGDNCHAIHSLFSTLYGHRDDLQQQMLKLVERWPPRS